MSLISINGESEREGVRGGRAREAAKLGCGGCSFLLNCPDSITQWEKKSSNSFGSVLIVKYASPLRMMCLGKKQEQYGAKTNRAFM